MTYQEQRAKENLSKALNLLIEGDNNYDNEKAIDCYNEAIKNDPIYLRAFIGQGNAYHALKDNE